MKFKLPNSPLNYLSEVANLIQRYHPAKEKQILLSSKRVNFNCVAFLTWIINFNSITICSSITSLVTSASSAPFFRGLNLWMRSMSNPLGILPESSKSHNLTLKVLLKLVNYLLSKFCRYCLHEYTNLLDKSLS